MNEELKYYCKTPKASNEKELINFYRLVLEGGKVEKNGLYDRILNCAVLGYCTHGEKIIGISAIKIPLRSYREKIISKANLKRKTDNLEYEIGYSYTSPKFRRMGISTNIKSNIIDWMRQIGGNVFSTTAISSSQKNLKNKGFIQHGDKYDGKNDKDLKYFELKINKTK